MKQPNPLAHRFVAKGLTFDDVLLLPAYSDVLPKMVNTSTTLCGRIHLKVPFISAAMDTVTEAKMAIALAQQGGVGIIHKNMSIEQQAAAVKKVKSIQKNNEKLAVGAALGITEDYIERATALCKAGCDLLALDSAHGHSKGVIAALKILKKEFKTIPVIAGNVATAKGALALADAGADAVKVGIGPGSICTTRIVAGVGVPQLTAILEVSMALKNRPVSIIADGGIRYAGDVVKALAAGAHAVMMGSIFASTTESPGKTIVKNGKKYKQFRGMGSDGAMLKGSGDRYFQDKQTDIKKLVAEGVEGWVEVKGSMEDIVYSFAGGLRAGMGYCGATTIDQLQNALFIEITPAGITESLPHDIIL